MVVRVANVRRRRPRGRRTVVVQNTQTTRGSNGRARRRRERRRRMAEELRICRSGTGGVDTSDLGSAPVASMSSGLIPGVPMAGAMTKEGQNWALKALHPNGEEATGVAGIPDHVSVPVVTPEFRLDSVIASIGTAASSNDDVDIVALPFADLPAIYRRYRAGQDPEKNVYWKPLWNPTMEVDSLNVQRPAQKLDKSSGSTKWIPKVATAPVSSSRLDHTYGYGRATHKGITVHLDAAALNDQGRIAAGQVSLPFRATAPTVIASAWDLTTDPISKDPVEVRFEDVEAFSVDTLPLDEACLVQTAPGSMVSQARDGCYMPLRFRDPAHQFTPSGEACPLVFAGSPSRLASPRFIADYSTDVAPPAGLGYTGTLHPVLAPRMLLNLQTGIVLIRGVSPNANVHVKLITGLEAMVETCSAISPYQRMSPSLDCDAINYVARMSQELGQAFPASYNDMGGLIGSIITAGKKIRGGLSKIPGIGKIWEWQNKYVYDPLGLNSPQRMPTATGWHDPLSRVYDRMNRNGYHGLYR